MPWLGGDASSRALSKILNRAGGRYLFVEGMNQERPSAFFYARTFLPPLHRRPLVLISDFFASAF